MPDGAHQQTVGGVLGASGLPLEAKAMTEQEWVVCMAPMPMLEFLRGKASERKLRLFVVAFCRTRWNDLSPLVEARQAVVVAERWADEQASNDEIETASRLVVAAMPFAVRGLLTDAWVAAEIATHTGQGERQRQAELLREILGNPFHPMGLNTAWVTPTITGLAQSIYRQHAFDRLPILANTLEEAGCSKQDILNHCRQPGVHARGCWALDLILGKS
jgi:hypothetical protein